MAVVGERRDAAVRIGQRLRVPDRVVRRGRGRPVDGRRLHAVRGVVGERRGVPGGVAGGEDVPFEVVRVARRDRRGVRDRELPPGRVVAVARRAAARVGAREQRPRRVEQRGARATGPGHRLRQRRLVPGVGRRLAVRVGHRRDLTGGRVGRRGRLRARRGRRQQVPVGVVGAGRLEARVEREAGLVPARIGRDELLADLVEGVHGAEAVERVVREAQALEAVLVPGAVVGERDDPGGAVGFELLAEVVVEVVRRAGRGPRRRRLHEIAARVGEGLSCCRLRRSA